jgi:hypothetical protein
MMRWTKELPPLKKNWRWFVLSAKLAFYRKKQRQPERFFIAVSRKIATLSVGGGRII